MIDRLPHLLLTLSLALALTACGDAPESGQEPDGGQQTQQQTQRSSGQEETPPPPEPAESPPLEGEPKGEVVELASGPEGVVADPETGLLAIATRNRAELVIADGESGDVVSRTELPAPARHLDLAESGGPVLVTSAKADALFQIGLPGGNVQSETSVGDFPHNAAAYEDRVFVINEFASTMSVIRDGEVVDTVQTPLWPGGIAVTDDGRVAVLGVRGLSIRLYDAETLESLGEADAGEGPTHVVAGPSGRLYVADTRGGALLIYETDPELKRVGSVPLEGSPYGIALDPRRGELWITLTARNSLVRFKMYGDAVRETGRFPTVRQPNTVSVNPQTGRIYVTGRAEDELQILSPGEARPGTTTR